MTNRKLVRLKETRLVMNRFADSIWSFKYRFELSVYWKEDMKFVWVGKYFFEFEMVYLVLSSLQVKFKEKTNNLIHASYTTWAHAL